MKQPRQIIIDANLLSDLLQHQSCIMSLLCNYELSDFTETALYECIQVNRDIQFTLAIAMQGEIIDEDVRNAIKEYIKVGLPFS